LTLRENTERPVTVSQGTRGNKPLQNRGGCGADPPRRRQDRPNAATLGWTRRRTDSRNSPAWQASWEKPHECQVREWEVGTNLTRCARGVTRRCEMVRKWVCYLTENSTNPFVGCQID
jgi:hypothetical protein